MTEATLLGIIVAGIGALGVFIGHLVHRLDRLEDHNLRLWAWCRKHLDLYYRHRREGAPDPDPVPDPE